MKNIFILIIFMVGVSISDASASHIVAGFSSYTHISDNSYEIKYTLIRDKLSGGSILDDDIFVQVYSFDGINYIFQGNVLTENAGTFAVTHGDQQEIADQFSIDLEFAEYKFDFELTNPNEDYLFVYQRCCRSPNFSNIANPSENGITLITTITTEAQALQNSSITFEKLPNFIALVNQEQSFPIDAISIDGDTLSYQFAPSFYGGGLAGFDGNPGEVADCDGLVPQGPCYPPYNMVEFATEGADFTSPFPGWSDQKMNATDGVLEGIPIEVGQHAYGFVIHEYRNGQIINSTAFDYIVYAVPFTSSTQNSLPNILKLIGNPSSDQFILENTSGLELNLTVYNLKGEKINAEIEISKEFSTISFQGPVGMYILKAQNQEINENFKLIKL